MVRDMILHYCGMICQPAKRRTAGPDVTDRWRRATVLSRGKTTAPGEAIARSRCNWIAPEHGVRRPLPPKLDMGQERRAQGTPMARVRQAGVRGCFKWRFPFENSEGFVLGILVLAFFSQERAQYET